jgi:hypothetical protein
MMVPHPKWTPTPATNKAEEITVSPTTEIKHQDIGLSVDFVTGSTKQFPLLWLSVFGNATGGLALLSSVGYKRIDCRHSISFSHFLITRYIVTLLTRGVGVVRVF